MPNYGAYTFRQVQAAILPGRPATLLAAGRAMASVAKATRSLRIRLSAASRPVPVETRVPAGPGVVLPDRLDELVSLLDCLALSLQAYESALTGSATALSRAQSELAQFAGDVAAYRAQMAAIGVGSDDASIDAEARKILETLASAYRDAIRDLRWMLLPPQGRTSDPPSGTESGQGRVPATSGGVGWAGQFATARDTSLRELGK